MTQGSWAAASLSYRLDDPRQGLADPALEYVACRLLAEARDRATCVRDARYVQGLARDRFSVAQLQYGRRQFCSRLALGRVGSVCVGFGGGSLW
jgi:hypothetical protein